MRRYRLTRDSGRLVVRYARPRIRRDRQGGIIPADPAKARAADLITLPHAMPGTNCGNCRFGRGLGGGVLMCQHPRMGFPVSDRNCCAYWDNLGAFRSWR